MRRFSLTLLTVRENIRVRQAVDVENALGGGTWRLLSGVVRPISVGQGIAWGPWGRLGAGLRVDACVVAVAVGNEGFGAVGDGAPSACA